jgi:uncharacterized protein
LAKLIFIVLVTVLIVLWFKSTNRRRDADDHRADRRPPIAENMVRCKVCGVNLPRSEAIMSRGQFYCSEQHRLGDKS